eukprot:s69_g23.t1
MWPGHFAASRFRVLVGAAWTNIFSLHTALTLKVRWIYFGLSAQSCSKLAALASCVMVHGPWLWLSCFLGLPGVIGDPSDPAASPDADGRVASFLVLGDWGWDPVAHGDVRSRFCQQSIANKMDETFQELGDVKFVINVGDSFYPSGVFDAEDEQWDSKWRQVYSAQVRSVP